MILLFIKRYRTMLLVGVVFFYIGSMFALSLTRLECAEALSTSNKNKLLNSFEKYEYAVLIISGPENESQRDTIRATWGQLTNNIYKENGEILYKWNQTRVDQRAKEDHVKFIFVVGTVGLSASKLSKLKLENMRSKDLLLLNTFEDSYKTLTTKMLHSLKWISANMKSLKYLIKCDDDSFVRVDLIVRDLEAFAPNMDHPSLRKYISFKKYLPSYKGLYWGYFNGQARVFLNGKWEEKDWFLCSNYLPYALGGGYVISHSIIDFIARNADFMSLYNSEDVSMGVWTANLDGINRVHDVRFDTEWVTRGCLNHMLIRHKQTSSDMFSLYTNLVNTHGETLCKTEKSTKTSYMYNWNVLSKDCCKSSINYEDLACAEYTRDVTAGIQHYCENSFD